MSSELPAVTRHRRNMTENFLKAVQPEQTTTPIVYLDIRMCMYANILLMLVVIRAEDCLSLPFQLSITHGTSKGVNISIYPLVLLSSYNY